MRLNAGRGSQTEKRHLCSCPLAIPISTSLIPPTTTAKMPSEVLDIKNFLEIARRKDAKCTLTRSLATDMLRHASPVYEWNANSNPAARMKRTPIIRKGQTSHQIKFKIRCKRYLYTLILNDASKADKIKQSLPPCKSYHFFASREQQHCSQ